MTVAVEGQKGRRNTIRNSEILQILCGVGIGDSAGTADIENRAWF